MKANELRIGNLLQGNNGVVSIREIGYSGYVRILWNSSIFYVTGNNRCLDPIPLTEEWLLKFGFEEEYSQLTSIYKYYLPNSPFGYSQGDFRVFTQTGSFSVKIDYVHQLQNLYFALTGEELALQENGNQSN